MLSENSHSIAREKIKINILEEFEVISNILDYFFCEFLCHLNIRIEIPVENNVLKYSRVTKKRIKSTRNFTLHFTESADN